MLNLVKDLLDITPTVSQVRIKIDIFNLKSSLSWNCFYMYHYLRGIAVHLSWKQ